jgi:hypothetical protein
MGQMNSWEERFWTRVNKTDGCWLWTGHIHSHGYGMLDLRVDGKKRDRPHRAHRLAFLLANGFEPQAPLEVCHTCDVRHCVNPQHLFVGTRSDNMRDCVAKGRQHQKRVTHCPQGHAYEGENLIVRPGSRRGCRACKNAANVAYRASKSRRRDAA